MDASESLFVHRKMDLGEPAHGSGRGVLTVLIVTLLVSVALNSLLASRVRDLMHRQSLGLAEQVLKIGTILPPISARRLGGSSEEISYRGSDRPTVLYIFTPPCTWCRRNLDNFNSLVSQKPREYRFIGISLSETGLSDYVLAHGMQIPVYTVLSADKFQAYKIAGTPQTIVVSSEGRVIQNWIGAYAGDQGSQVEAFFHAKLPGLRLDPQEHENGQQGQSE